MNNIPCCIEITTNNECAVHIEMKVILVIFVASNKRFKPLNVRELSKRSKGTIDIELNIIEALQLLDS